MAPGRNTAADLLGAHQDPQLTDSQSILDGSSGNDV